MLAPAGAHAFEPHLEATRAFFANAKTQHNIDYTQPGLWGYSFVATTSAAAGALIRRLEAEGLKVVIVDLEDGSTVVTGTKTVSMTPEKHYANLKRFVALGRTLDGVRFAGAALPR